MSRLLYFKLWNVQISYGKHWVIIICPGIFLHFQSLNHTLRRVMNPFIPLHAIMPFEVAPDAGESPSEKHPEGGFKGEVQ